MDTKAPIRTLIVLAAGLLGLVACGTPTAPPALSPTTTGGADIDAARRVLTGFLQSLNQGRFDEAVMIYAGPYDAINVFDPTISPKDYLALLRNACMSSNLRCLAPRRASLKETPLATEYVFLVEFNNPDGTLFVRGPCCGATETETPPQSAFEFRVVKANGSKFSILDLPPYVP